MSSALQHNCESLASRAGKACTPLNAQAVSDNQHTYLVGEESMGMRVPHRIQAVSRSGNSQIGYLRTIILH
jgi:hypothetical protein